MGDEALPSSGPGSQALHKTAFKIENASRPVISDRGINNEKFHMELPYQQIKEIVEKCGAEVLGRVPQEERDGLVWEHVGSTSIPGMPGAMMPDALLLLPQFPPTKAVVQALLDSGYYFHAASHL